MHQYKTTCKEEHLGFVYISTVLWLNEDELSLHSADLKILTGNQLTVQFLVHDFQLHVYDLPDYIMDELIYLYYQYLHQFLYFTGSRKKI